MGSKVLLVEDSTEVAALVIRMLAGLRPNLTVLLAEDQMEARQLFLTHRGDLELVVMDGQVPGNRSGVTLDLIEWIRHKGFTGMIIGYSAEPFLRVSMLAAGCSEWIDKFAMVPEFRRILGQAELQPAGQPAPNVSNGPGGKQ